MGRRLSVRQVDGLYVVWRSGSAVTTPLGNPVVTVHKPLAEEVAEEIRLWGLDPERGGPSFLALCWTLDFTWVPDSGIVDTCVEPIGKDPLLGLSHPLIQKAQMRVLKSPWFEEHQLPGLDKREAVRWVRERTEGWSRQELMALQLMVRETGSVLASVGLVEGALRPTEVVHGLCIRYVAHVTDTWITKDWFAQNAGCCDFCRYDPPMEPDFCRDACLRTAADAAENESADRGEMPREAFLEHCAVARALDKWQRFAGYGRRAREEGREAWP